MKEPQTVPYRTVYGNRHRKLWAADKYNAATQRALKDTGVKWRFVSTDDGHKFTVGRFQRRRTIEVL